jgi:hypothetical protein
MFYNQLLVVFCEYDNTKNCLVTSKKRGQQGSQLKVGVPCISTCHLTVSQAANVSLTVSQAANGWLTVSQLQVEFEADGQPGKLSCTTCRCHRHCCSSRCCAIAAARQAM